MSVPPSPTPGLASGSSRTGYSSFWALLIFFLTMMAMDLHQTVKLHREKLAVMRQYDQARQLGGRVAEQTRWIGAMQQELLRLAPGDPEAAQIVADLKLRVEK